MSFTSTTNRLTPNRYFGLGPSLKHCDSVNYTCGLLSAKLLSGCVESVVQNVSAA